LLSYLISAAINLKVRDGIKSDFRAEFYELDYDLVCKIDRVAFSAQIGKFYSVWEFTVSRIWDDFHIDPITSFKFSIPQSLHHQSQEFGVTPKNPLDMCSRLLQLVFRDRTYNDYYSTTLKDNLEGRRTSDFVIDEDFAIPPRPLGSLSDSNEMQKLILEENLKEAWCTFEHTTFFIPLEEAGDRFAWNPDKFYAVYYYLDRMTPGIARSKIVNTGLSYYEYRQI
jgi:hypothetical protein